MNFAKLRLRTMLVAVLAAVFAFGSHALAQTNAYTTTFTTSITYQNVGSATANINLIIYGATGSVFSTSSTIPVNGAGSYFVGGVAALGSSFNGSAVISSDQPVAATLVQIPASTSPVKNRALSNGFSSGAATVLVPTILKNTTGNGTTSKLAVQNTDSVANDITVEFVSGATVVHTANATNVAANSAVYYDASTISALGASFNGSARITAKKAGTSTAGSAVATAMELGIGNSLDVYAFQGFPSTDASTTVYMATALCGNTGQQTTFYAIQNTGASPADITVTYSNGKTQTFTGVASGAKVGSNPCAAGSAAGFSGSATVTATQPVLAIGKVSGAGWTTAFEGAKAGSSKIALPYTRWSNPTTSGQLTFIAIQNVNGSTLTDVTVKYYNASGTLLGTHSIASIADKAKANSTPSSAGITAMGPGGSAVVESTSGGKLIVVARVTSPVNTGIVAEDYNGIPVQ